jgi:acetylornithine deacetylase
LVFHEALQEAPSAISFASAYYPAQIVETKSAGLEEAPVLLGTDIAVLPQVEQRYLFGSGSIQVAHTPDEGLSQEELVRGAETG